MTAPTIFQWQAAKEHIVLPRLSAVFGGWRSQGAAWLVPFIYALCLTAFVADLFSANTLAFGVFYTPLVATAVFHRDPRAVWVLSAIAIALVFVGSLLPNLPLEMSELVTNRLLSVAAILATAAFVRHARSVQDKLAHETRRAEAAERMKTEVLNNLSQEIRAPLYSMMGVLELVALDSQPALKANLGIVRLAGRRLAATIDNLVDLTQFGEEPIPVEPIDLGCLLREVADASQRDAAARQIALTANVLPSAVQVQGNSWAVRRILENLLADAIGYTPPGGRIDVRIALDETHATVVISDTGARPPGVLLSQSASEIERLVPAQMGMVLCRRLSDAIGGRLIVHCNSNDETTARLTLAIAATSNAPRSNIRELAAQASR